MLIAIMTKTKAKRSIINNTNVKINVNANNIAESSSKDLIGINIARTYVDSASQDNNRILFTTAKTTHLKNKIINKKLIGCLINGAYYYKAILTEYLKKIFTDISIEYHETNIFDCDILVSSYFGNEPIDNVDYLCYKIFISGEPTNINNLLGYDLCIDTKSDINYLPQQTTHIYLPFYVNSLFERRKNTPIDLLKEKNYNKTKFCAFLYSICHKHRDNFFDKLNIYKKVDAIGKCRGNIDKNNICGNVETDRRTYNENVTYNDLAVEKYKPYKFVIAFENTNVEGYITEKLINPMFASAIPIYFGTNKVKDHFNPKSFIYVNDFKDYDECIEYIIKIDNDNDLYDQYMREPYLMENKLNEYLIDDNVIINNLKKAFME
jgi:hypothetical protein